MKEIQSNRLYLFLYRKKIEFFMFLSKIGYGSGLYGYKKRTSLKKSIVWNIKS